MGTVHASRGDDPNNPPETLAAERCIKCVELAMSEPGNPGTFRDIHKKVKDLYPRNFDGAFITVNKKLSNHFKVSHTLTMSPVTPSGYKFGARYEGTTTIGKKERYPALASTVMPNGSQTMSFAHTLGCRCRLTLAGQMSRGACKTSSAVVDYRTDDCTLSLSLDNPSMRHMSGTVALHFLQSVSSGLALGAEIACLMDKAIGRRTIMSGAARYSTGPFTVSGTLGEAGVHVCCHRRASHQLQVGAELEMNLKTRESHATVIYQLDVPKANFVFRGLIDSRRTVSGVFEKKLSEAYKSSLLISAALNHGKGQFRVGVGLTVG